MTDKRIAVGYIRVSTDEQAREGLSLDAQRARIEEYASQNNMTLLKFYVDDGVSGKIPIKKRKALSELLTDITKREFDTILFIRLDRWFRNVGAYYEAQKILDEKKPSMPEEILSEPVEPEPPPEEPPVEIKSLSTHFSMDVELDKTRLNKSFNSCIGEVVSFLMNEPNVKVSIQLVVNISAPEGISEETKALVAENCHNLKIENFYFDD